MSSIIPPRRAAAARGRTGAGDGAVSETRGLRVDQLHQLLVEILPHLPAQACRQREDVPGIGSRGVGKGVGPLSGIGWAVREQMRLLELAELVLPASDVLLSRFFGGKAGFLEQQSGAAVRAG